MLKPRLQFLHLLNVLFGDEIKWVLSIWLFAYTQSMVVITNIIFHMFTSSSPSCLCPAPTRPPVYTVDRILFYSPDLVLLLLKIQHNTFSSARFGKNKQNVGKSLGEGGILQHCRCVWGR